MNGKKRTDPDDHRQGDINKDSRQEPLLVLRLRKLAGN